MRSRLFFGIIVLIVVIGFVFFAFTRTVRFSEAAVVALFGSADENSVRREPGLVLRLPEPFQTVTVYDTRARLLEMRSETQQTRDNRQIVVEGFLIWKVSDPLRFYRRFGGEGADVSSHVAAAERSLQAQLRSAMSAVSGYELTDLFTVDPGGSRLPELEERVMASLAEATEDADALGEWGVEPLRVGIARVVLPEETTKSVFERMKATQERLAAEAESRGAAQANTIVDSAMADATRIRAFADRRAEEIRVRGDREATPYLERLAEDEDLAVFLEQLAFLRDFFGKRATLLLSTDMPGLEVFRQDVMERLGDNGLPRFGLEGDALEGDEEAAGADARREGGGR